MAKLMTFIEAQRRFENLATTGITIDLAIQEAIDRIYEMGRWPGTTVEIQLTEEMFVEDSETGDFFVSFVESEYDGAIGFRSTNGGWSIMDQSALYKDGLNAGDDAFIDFGTIIDEDTGARTRKYRAPVGFVPNAGPYYVLLKKEAPVLDHDSVIPVESVGALKAAIQAVCYEYVTDDQRAAAKWQEFDQFMRLSDKQVSGPKKYFVGMDSSLRRRPTQFM
jgi:hypothetical protein